MKLSYKLTITLLATVTAGVMLPALHAMNNQEGKLYDALPATVKNSGKTVTLKMSSCPQPSTIQIIYFYKIAGAPTSEGGLTQIIQFQSTNTSQTVNILPPLNEHDAKIIIKIMPKTVWDLHVKAITAQTNTNATTAQKTAAMKLMQQVFHSPTNTLSKEYVDIKQKDVIILPYADATVPKVDQMNQNWIDEQFGITYEQLKPYLNKQPGKTIQVKITPQITEPMMVSISSSVTKPNGNSANVTQIITFTPDTDKIDVKIPQPSGTSVFDQDISFSIEPEKIFSRLKSISTTTRTLSTDEKEEKETVQMLEMSVQNRITHPYAQLNDKQTVTLTAPTKKITLIKALLGCAA